MPRTPSILPSDRFFARLDRFECECPSCGELVFTDHDTRKHPLRLNTHARRRAAAAALPRNINIWGMVYNPVSQRLHCPFCRTSYVAGLLLYPVLPGLRRPIDAPPDTVPTKRQRLEMRTRMTGGWYAEKTFRQGDEVNLVVTASCSCPVKGWAPACALHGDPAYLGGSQPAATSAAAPVTAAPAAGAGEVAGGHGV